ncbi:hypothetical protein [Enterococcus sp. HY326]|uniref:hypothetical protein n=1 Tax=Enterococcus sp. HY326 TaxID=2971265 RepID=UPI00223E9CE8|nr:hypothetical protein [Enterococcus sp. HY326]
MKKILGKKSFWLGMIVFLALLTGCNAEEAFLTIEKASITTSEAGTATISGETNPDSTVKIDEKTIETDDGSFNHEISLTSLTDKNVVVTIDFNGDELKKEVLVRPSSTFIETTERADAETVLALAEKNPNQKNYDQAFTLIASLSKEYSDISERLAIIEEHLPIITAIEAAETDPTRTNLTIAQEKLEQATLNKSALTSRVTSIEENVIKKEEVEKQTADALAAVEKAEQSLNDEDYNQAVTLLAALPTTNTDLTNRIEQVNQSIANKKAEEQRIAEEAAATAAAEAAAAAEENANAQTPTAQMVMVTPTGKKYHTHKCGNGNYSEATLDEALARGLTPCAKCFP